MLGKGGKARGILFDQIPLLSLGEGAAQEIVNLLDRGVGHEGGLLGIFLLAHLLNGRRFLQCLIILLQRT